MLSEGQKVSVEGYDRTIRLGPKVILNNDLERQIAVRTVFEQVQPPNLQRNDEFYKPDAATVFPAVEMMPSWHLLYSVNPFPAGNYTDRMRTGSNRYTIFLPPDAVDVGQNLLLRQNHGISGDVRRLNRPVEIIDWNNNSIIVTGAIELTPRNGETKIGGRIGSAFEDERGRPLGILISRSEDAWFLAPLAPFLEETGLSYCDQLATDTGNLITRIGSAPILTEEAA